MSIEIKFNSRALEERLANPDKKPDKKQWLPLYGIYQIIRDGLAGKPTIIDFEAGAKERRYLVISALEQLAPIVGACYGLRVLAEKLF